MQQRSKTDGLVYVEMQDGTPVRIFANVKAAVAHPQDLITMMYADAVGIIRRKVFTRENMTCSHCGASVTWDTGEMHERQWRGRGGEISVDNSTLVCNTCHHHTEAGHGKRKPQWSRQ